MTNIKTTPAAIKAMAGDIMNSTQQGYGWEEVTDKETGWKICREEIVEGDDTKGRRLYRVTETSPEGVATVTHESIIAEWGNES